jgi:regulator of protease activity HflC (stomatin/prohibitin superfamily)
MNRIKAILVAGLMAMALTACGSRVEVPPAHVGKVMTKDGYREGVVGTSKFRLDPCIAYCDKLVLLDVSDQAYTENMEIFIPEDKLKLKIAVRVNLTVDKKGANALFDALPPQASNDNDNVAAIARDTAYKTYAQQIVLTETREYLSQFSIAEIASSMEKVNADLRTRLQKSLQSRTPFAVRYVGITNIAYPDIITEAQENAARRREEIQQEEAKMEVSRVALQRQLQEAQLQRKIDVEKAEADAEADRVRALAITPAVITLRKLENERAQIDMMKEKWDGAMPKVAGEGQSSFLLNLGDTIK